MRPLLPYLKRYRWGFVFGAFCVVMSNGAWAGLPRVIGKAAQSLEGGVTSHKLLVFTAQVLALAAVRGVFLFLTRWVVIGISRDIEFDLRNDLFAHLETLSYSYYQRTRTGDIMARVTNDLNAVRMLMGPAIMYSANTFVFTAVALWFMVHSSPRLT
ncbi:MAG: ABC transporter transmembrane domain-containing protein, partial [Candidatus Sulfotelmatobacter sp.]